MQYNVSDFKKIEGDLAAFRRVAQSFSLLPQAENAEQERHQRKTLARGVDWENTVFKQRMGLFTSTKKVSKCN